MSPFQHQPMWCVELSPFQRRAERRLARPFNQQLYPPPLPQGRVPNGYGDTALLRRYVAIPFALYALRVPYMYVWGEENMRSDIF